MPREEDLARCGLYETYQTLEQDGLARTTTPDDTVDVSRLKGSIDFIQYDLVVKRLAESSDLYDLSPFSHDPT